MSHPSQMRISMVLNYFYWMIFAERERERESASDVLYSDAEGGIQTYCVERERMAL